MDLEITCSESSPEILIQNICSNHQINPLSDHKIASKREVFRTVSRKQIEELVEKVRSEINKNKKKYQKLIGLNPYFTMKLYQPHHHFKAEDLNSNSIKLLLQQIDLLLDEANIIEKQINKTELRRMQSDHIDPTQRQEVKHHFSYLRKVWLDLSKVQCNSDVQRLQELNKRVVLIKNNVLQLNEHQKQCYALKTKNSYVEVDKIVKSVVQKSVEFTLLKQRYQRALMGLEEADHRLQRIAVKHSCELVEKEKDILRLIRQNEDLRRQNKDLKQKVIFNQKKEMQLAQKINGMQRELKENNKDLAIKTEISHSSIPQHTDFAEIKFRKIEFNNQINFVSNFQDHHDQFFSQKKQPVSKEASQELIQEMSQETSEQISSSFSLPLNNIQKHLLNENRQTTSSRSNLLNDSKIDDKKGRFSRMRSPCNGRLLKQQGAQESSLKSRVTLASRTHSQVQIES